MLNLVLVVKSEVPKMLRASRAHSLVFSKAFIILTGSNRSINQIIALPRRDYIITCYFVYSKGEDEIESGNGRMCTYDLRIKDFKEFLLATN